MSKIDLSRYSRQLPVIGTHGQLRLQQARVLCVGAGGLGSPALLYLAAAGVGKIGIVDGDQVALSNLHRQILYRETQVGETKVHCAQQNLQALNATVEINTYPVFLDENNAQKIIADYDVILDGTDNFESRYLINRTCRALSKPLVSASVLQFSAQLGVFNYQNGPCYECLYPQQPAADTSSNCAQAGVLNVLPGVVGALQASEAMKIILERGHILSGQLLCIDLLTMQFSQLAIHKQHSCNKTSCTKVSTAPVQTDSNDMQTSELSSQQLQALFDNKTRITLIDVREPDEHAAYHLGGRLIPLNTLAENIDTIAHGQPIIMYCQHGIRSRQAMQYLLSQGYQDVYNLSGGIAQWIDDLRSAEN